LTIRRDRLISPDSSSSGTACPVMPAIALPAARVGRPSMRGCRQPGGAATAVPATGRIAAAMPAPRHAGSGGDRATGAASRSRGEGLMRASARTPAAKRHTALRLTAPHKSAKLISVTESLEAIRSLSKVRKVACPK
jgi:hypothetical protein